MTTIVASVDHGCICADHRITGDSAIGHISKLRRIRDAIYGIAGEIDPAFLFLEWLERLNPKESYRKRIEALHKMIPEDSRSSFTAIELSEAGLAYYSGWGVRVALLDREWCTGTGGAVALSHIKEGMSPWEAVRRSPVLDECSGYVLEPEILFLEPPEFT